MDGKHISIVPPSGSGSEFFNYKGRHSMVLLAIVNADYQFIMCDFGTNGRISDGGVLNNTKFYEKFQNGDLKIPDMETVKDTSRKLPYVFVADDAFPLQINIMKPFRQAALVSIERKVFNYRLSRARRIVENVFGIMAARFRIFHTQINLEPKNIDSIVMACCVLHNFLMKSAPNTYAPTEVLDHDDIENGITTFGLDSQDSNMDRLDRRTQGNTNNAAKNVREDFMSYFSNEGKVPWQLNFVY